ncbi:hypothetical protein QEZ40_004903 [Streptomyces katrae]|uniref:Uncharacterized protein n=1 Tax=Streptomyces katrae TaxID=68223 RepID=A0ABT7H0U5_9ACTN|nr:hypothetical protein [Streptomyces katrae]MDK9499479.1 hypothetical protein [Streptomyces katrae]
MRTVRGEQAGDVMVWVRRGGFPGELREGDADIARRFLAAAPAGVRAVVIALGGEAFRWVDADGDEDVLLEAGGAAEEAEEDDVGPGPDDTDGGFALGTGDGATLPGLPVSWALLEFRCPHGDATVLVARHPDVPPACPVHHVPLLPHETAAR